MNKLQEITPVFTEELPYKKDMEFGKIYISREHEVACFLCPCGCGEVHHISFIKGLRNQWVFSIKREAMFDELCMLLGVHSVEELLTLVKSGKIGYIHESEERTYELNKLHSLAPKPFVMPKDGKPWYKQFDNKKHKK